jgi:hypothetical protein
MAKAATKFNLKKSLFFYLTFLGLFLSLSGINVQAEEWRDTARNVLIEIRPNAEKTGDLNKDKIREIFAQELQGLSAEAPAPMRFDGKMNTTTAATMVLDANTGKTVSSLSPQDLEILIKQSQE